jgi:hypothetical protein
MLGDELNGFGEKNDATDCDGTSDDDTDRCCRFKGL